MKHIKIFLIALLLSLSSSFPSSALGGTTAVDATGDSKVVALIYGGENWQRGCSGAAIAPRIVVTAAHCVYGEIDGKWGAGNPKETKIYGELTVGQKFWVSKPGVLVPLGGTKEKVRVVAQYPSKKYVPGKPSDQGKTNGHSILFDFAVLVVESPITDKTFRFATGEEVAELRKSAAEILSIGYGYQSYEDFIDANKGLGNKPNPNKSIGTISRNRVFQGNNPSQIGALEEMMQQVRYPEGTFGGGGDSGSPVWFQKNNEWIYIGATCCTLGRHASTPPGHPDRIKGNFWHDNAGIELHSAFAFPELFEEAYNFLNKENNKIQQPAPPKVAKSAQEIKCKRNKQIISIKTKRQSCPRGWELQK